MLAVFTLFLTLVLPFTHPMEPRRNTSIFFGCSGRLRMSKMSNARALQYKLNHNLSTLQIPERFDSRKKWPFCHSIGRVSQQGKCGGCWAFASTGVMSDRLCIATRGKFDRQLSTQDLLECCPQCTGDSTYRRGGCEGGYFDKAFIYWMTRGIVTGDAGCKPMSAGIVDGISQKKCRRSCTNGHYTIPYQRDKLIGGTIYIERMITAEVMEQIKAEMMLNGPVAVGMVVYMDVMDYVNKQGPKYIWKEDPKIFNGSFYQHAVRIIGWDVMNGVPVWIVGNSWGKEWADHGFFYVRRGFNDFGIEGNQMVTGIPHHKLPESVLTYQPDPNYEKPSASTGQCVQLNYLLVLCTFFWQLCLK